MSVEKLAKFLNAKLSGEEYIARCPAHDDTNPSLSFTEGEKVPIVVHCHKGCEPQDIIKKIESMGFEWPKKFEKLPQHKKKPTEWKWVPWSGNSIYPPDTHPKAGKPIAVHSYGKYGFIYRFDGSPKCMPLSLCEHVNSKRQSWQWRAFPDPQPLYRIDECSEAKTIIVVEGEKCVDALRKIGFAATTWVGGTNRIAKANWDEFPKGRKVYLWPDNDKPGKEAMDWLKKKIGGTMIEIHHDFPEGWDCADAIESGWDAQQIKEFVQKNVARESSLSPMEKLERHVIPMGFDRESFYYYIKESKSLMVLTPQQHNKMNYISMAAMDVWREFLGVDEMTERSWISLTDMMMRACRSKNYFTTEYLRGRGCWEDQGRIVVHLGDRLLIDGEECPLGDIKSKYVYEIGEPLPGISGSILPNQESRRLLEVCAHLRWKDKGMGVLLAGFIALTPICGVLPWRPHIFITGSKLSGKTTVMNRIVKHFLQEWGLSADDNTTESGIRKFLGGDARAVVFDEAGAENQRNMERMQQVFNLARSSSSSDSSILKGSNKGEKYVVRAMFVFSAVNPNVANDQDQSRMALLQLKSPLRNDSSAKLHFSELLQMLQPLDAAWCKRLHARSIRNVRTTLANIQTFKDAALPILGDMRKADQFGTLVAGAYSLHDDNLVTLEEATNWIKSNAIESAFFDKNDEKDEERCLNHLMMFRHRFSYNGINGQKVVERNVGEYLDYIAGEVVEDYDPDQARKEMARIGMRLEDGWLYMPNKHRYLDHIFKNTPWQASYGETLRRLPGSEISNDIKSFGGIKARGFRLLWKKDNNGIDTQGSIL